MFRQHLIHASSFMKKKKNISSMDLYFRFKLHKNNIKNDQGSLEIGETIIKKETFFVFFISIIKFFILIFLTDQIIF
jgi:hypothetical protein